MTPIKFFNKYLYLQSLSISSANLTIAFFADLKNLQRLTSLTIVSVSFDGRYVPLLVKKYNLRAPPKSSPLTMQDTALPSFPQLQSLTLSYFDINAKWIQTSLPKPDLFWI